MKEFERTNENKMLILLLCAYAPKKNVCRVINNNDTVLMWSHILENAPPYS